MDLGVAHPLASWDALVLNVAAEGRTRLLLTAEDAARSALAGSPTITLDGTDLFPSEGRTSDLACRVYVTPEGLRGSPTTGQIIDAVRSRL